MSSDQVIIPGNVAVITGAADGIGLAAAQKLHGLGMRVCLADINSDKLAEAASTMDGALAVATDVSQPEQVEALRDRVYAEFGQVDLLMNNAGSGFGTTSWGECDKWRKTLEVNLFGVIHGQQVFIPAMLEAGRPGMVINTGSKQGITNPPGDPAYNTSKAAIRAMTEQLAHSFRNTEGCRLSAHLLVPGFTYTGIIRQWLDTKPDSAWWPEQVIDYLLQGLGQGDFYILCPDNDVSVEVDNKRMAWTMGDLIEKRPALSRWHPDYEKAFEEFMS